MDGYCRADVALRPFCRDDSECAVGHLCHHGVCRTPCASGTDEECLRADSQLTRCASTDDALLLCFTDHEASPECASAAECSPAEHCVDGVCRS